jgi:sarcosine oxidase subunit gamma
MAEAALRTAPLPAEPAQFAGVTITLAPPLARWSLRARDSGALGSVLGMEIPTKIGDTAGDMACLGPDEWLLRLPEGSAVQTGQGLPVSVVDISERAIGLTIEGPNAAELLMAGCPRDVAKFAVGYATRTIFEGVEIIILRTAPDRFEVEVWRSFAPWLWTALTKAASHIGQSKPTII